MHDKGAVHTYPEDWGQSPSLRLSFLISLQGEPWVKMLMWELEGACG